MTDYVLNWLGRVAIADGLLSDEEIMVLNEYAVENNIDITPFIDRLRELEKHREKRVVAVNPNVVKGVEFENLVFKTLRFEPGITVKSRSADHKLGIVYGLDQRSLQPDFFVCHKSGKFFIRYWIECKYRSGCVLDMTAEQLERYMVTQHEQGDPVFIAFGSGGEPSSPRGIYLIPLDDIMELKVASKQPDGSYLINIRSLSGYRCNLKYFKSEIEKYLR
jgi:hypothetical protein